MLILGQEDNSVRCVDFTNHVCVLCKNLGIDRTLPHRQSMGNHLAWKHKPYHIKEYTLEFYNSGIVPKCVCGCGQEVIWQKSVYQFGMYVNGHNSCFTRENQPDFTQEQIDYRNKKIRESYADPVRGPEICAKISESVLYYYANSDLAQRVSENMKKVWARESHRQKVSQSQRDAWARDYDARYTKIFTPEFCENVSRYMTQKLIDGNSIPWSKGTHSSPKSVRECNNYKSSWEIAFMLLLDTDEKITKWKYEPFRIKYRFDDKNKRYAPDFLVETSTGETYLIEVKPQPLRDRPMNVAKREAAIDHCGKNNLTYAEWSIDNLFPWSPS